MIKIRDQRILRNFMALGVVQGSNFLIPLIVMPYVISRIGADGFGEVALAQVVMTFFITISDYGFNLTATREVAFHKGDAGVISKIFFSVLITRLLICLLLFLLLLTGIVCIPFLRTHSALYLLSFITVVGQTFLINWLFQGIEQMKFITYITLLARVIFLVLVFGFIKDRDDHVYFTFFTGIGNLLAGIISMVVAFKLLKLRFLLPSRIEVKRELKGGFHIMISNLSISTYMYINVLILRLFTNNTIVGYYSIAEKVIMAARQVLGVYFQVIYPQVCLLATKNMQELHVFLKRNYAFFLCSTFLGGVVLLFFSEPAVAFFVADNQSIPSEFLRIMSFVPFIVCLNIPAYQVFLAFDKKEILLKVFVAGTLLNILLNLFWVPKLGGIGTCYIVLVTEVFITGSLLYFVNRNSKTKMIRYIM